VNPFRKNVISKLSPAKNESIVAFLISVLFAIIFWFLITFDKSYDSSIPFSVKFSNIPEDQVLKNTPPEALHLIIKAKGWDIFKIKRLRKNYTINVDIENYSNKDYILTNDFRKSFKGSPFSEIDIVNITPDKILIELEKKIEKVVPVKLNIDLSVKKQFGLAGPISIEPSQVTIKGPKTSIKKIDTIYTENLEFENVELTQRSYK